MGSCTPDVRFAFQLGELLEVELTVIVYGKNDLPVMTALNHAPGTTILAFLGMACSS